MEDKNNQQKHSWLRRLETPPTPTTTIFTVNSLQAHDQSILPRTVY